MKKVLAILVVLLMVPFVSMAATMSDADLAAVSGQSGVTIGITSSTIGLSFGSLTWGDYNGFSGYASAGYVNILAYPVPMHITLQGLELKIDVGTNAGVTAVQISIAGTDAATPLLKLDAFVADIVLDGVNGAVQDYQVLNTGDGTGTTYSMMTLADEGFKGTKTLGVFGISNVKVYAPAGGFLVNISAH